MVIILRKNSVLRTQTKSILTGLTVITPVARANVFRLTIMEQE